MTVVLVCGGRDYRNRAYLYGVLDGLHMALKLTRLIHGDARGADSLADEWARSRDVTVTAFPADWETLGRRAGPARNAVMLAERPQYVIAFPGGVGTRDMMRKARAKRVRVMEFLE
jgi:hypothetical protein